MLIHKQEEDPLDTSGLKEDIVTKFLRPGWSINPLLRPKAGDLLEIIKNQFTDDSFSFSKSGAK